MKTCNGKQCYGKHEARRCALSAMKARNRRIRVYECDECFFYHLTSEAKAK